MVCKKCGRNNPPNAVRCVYCGHALNSDSAAGKRRGTESAIVALIIIMISLLLVVTGVLIYKQNNSGGRFGGSGGGGGGGGYSIRNLPDENAVETPVTTVAPPTTKPTSAPTVEPPAPEFTSVEASSVRNTDTEGGEYSAYAVIDGQTLTKWVPEKNKSIGGVGEWIEIKADETQYVSGLYIENGYPKDAETWRKNNRVKDITVEFSNGTEMTFTLQDVKEAQAVDFGQTMATTFIKITIDSIYSGTTWNDTAIAEITAY